MSTASLQTEKNQESHRRWTTGVKELRQSLGVSEVGLLRVLKDLYGSTTSPCGLWQDTDKKLQEIGGHRILGDPCAGSGCRMTPRLVSPVLLDIWLVTWMSSTELETMLQLRGGLPKPKLMVCIFGAPSKRVNTGICWQ